MQLHPRLIRPGLYSIKRAGCRRSRRRLGRVKRCTRQQVRRHLTLAAHQQVMGRHATRITALQVHARSPKPAHCIPFAKIHRNQIGRAALRILRFIQVGTRIFEHLQGLLLAIAGGPARRGPAHHVADRIQRTAAVDQPLTCVEMAAMQGNGQRRKACALLHKANIVACGQALFQGRNISTFRSLDQFHCHEQQSFVWRLRVTLARPSKRPDRCCTLRWPSLYPFVNTSTFQSDLCPSAGSA